MELLTLPLITSYHIRNNKKMPLSAAERQRRCREKIKNHPDKVAEIKRKNLERYHARKKLVKDMTPKEHSMMKRKWQTRNRKRRAQLKEGQNVALNSPGFIKKTALSAAERQTRCRDKLKNDPDKVAEIKRKNLERYHARKKLVNDMTPTEHKMVKRKWQARNKKRRERLKEQLNKSDPENSENGSIIMAI